MVACHGDKEYETGPYKIPALVPISLVSSHIEISFLFVNHIECQHPHVCLGLSYTISHQIPSEYLRHIIGHKVLILILK